MAIVQREVEGHGPRIAQVRDAVSIEPQRVDEEGGRRGHVVGHDDALAVKVELRLGDHGRP
jgi:hypothetical protein